VKNLHLLFHSTGGIVGDGVVLHNYFKGLPFSLHLYNCGFVASIGVITYLGAPYRYATAGATFLVHKTRFGPVTAEAAKLIELAKSAEIDDLRTRQVLEASLNISRGTLDNFIKTERPITTDQAIKFGLVTEIRDFVVPLGETLFNI